MIRYLGQRISSTIPVLLLVSTVVFALLHLLPGDPVQLMLAGAESGSATPERMEALRHSLGLDQPLIVQYAQFLLNLLRGNLGTSIRFNAPVGSLVSEAALHTLELSLCGLAVAVLIGLPLGIIAALYENTWIDTFCMFLALIGVSMPLFWLGQLLILFVAIRLDLLPAISGTEANGLILPAVTLGFISAGLISRLTRANLSEALHSDYIRTARAKGVGEQWIVVRHALKNALIPVATVIGLQFGSMLGGAVVTETVFSRPGLGSLVVKGILWKDFPLVQGTVLFTATMYVVVNLLVDLAYAWLDPRIHYGKT